MRLGHLPFFRARGSHVAGAGVSGEDLALRCYELAKFYGTDPDVFLRKPISHISRAVRRTEELIERVKKAAED